MTRGERNAYMREYRQRPAVRERILAAKRESDRWNRGKNRARWNAHNKKPKRRRARRAWYVANRARILANSKTKRDYVAKFGEPPKRFVLSLDLMAKSLHTGRDAYGAWRKHLAGGRKRAVATRKANSKEHAKRRAEFKLYRSYVERFGPLAFFEYTRANLALVQKSLRTGKDALIWERRKVAKDTARSLRRRAETRAKEETRSAKQEVTPFTTDDECGYTSLVKKRRLREGACDLRWSDYFAFREANKCERLTANDMRYLSQWTGCPI